MLRLWILFLRFTGTFSKHSFVSFSQPHSHLAVVVLILVVSDSLALTRDRTTQPRCRVYWCNLLKQM